MFQIYSLEEIIVKVPITLLCLSIGDVKSRFRNCNDQSADRRRQQWDLIVCFVELPPTPGTSQWRHFLKQLICVFTSSGWRMAAIPHTHSTVRCLNGIQNRCFETLFKYTRETINLVRSGVCRTFGRFKARCRRYPSH